MAESFLNEVNRAEDILLGALGFGEDARIVSVELAPDGFYRGVGQFGDGETFEFSSDIEADELERWAIDILSRRDSLGSSPPKSKKR
jgi:hypothetical protein